MITTTALRTCPECNVEFESKLFDFCSDQCEVAYDKGLGGETPNDKEDA